MSRAATMLYDSFNGEGQLALKLLSKSYLSPATWHLSLSKGY